MRAVRAHFGVGTSCKLTFEALRAERLRREHEEEADSPSAHGAKIQEALPGTRQRRRKRDRVGTRLKAAVAERERWLEDWLTRQAVLPTAKRANAAVQRHFGVGVSNKRACASLRAEGQRRGRSLSPTDTALYQLAETLRTSGFRSFTAQWDGTALTWTAEVIERRKGTV